MTAHTVLCVDDEPGVLRSLQRLCRKEDYRLITAQSGEEGLQVLKSESAKLVISDQRMPSMTGTQFLRQVREHYPDTVRCILSGYAELHAILDAINEGEVYRFMTKPWDDAELKQSIRECLNLYDSQAEERNRLAELEHRTRDLEDQDADKQQLLLMTTAMLDSARDVLRHLPVPCFVVSDKNLVVFTNRAFNAHWSKPLGLSIGSKVNANIISCAQAIPDANGEPVARVLGFGEQTVSVRISCFKHDEHSALLFVVMD